MPTLAPSGQLEIQAIGDVSTEAGAIITNAEIAYHRWGEYRVDKEGRSNVVLIEHALTGDSNAADWWADLLGPGKAINTDIYCVICTNVIGGCNGSTGPGSMHPDGNFWGNRFPATSIRDQVNAEKQFLDALGITTVAAVLGGSMGGARTLEWAAMYPETVGAAAVLAVSARASAWQIGIQSAQIKAIENDHHWHEGNYYESGCNPATGLGAARRIAHLTYRGELEIDERFGTKAQKNENPLGPYRKPDQRFAVESYLDYQADKLVQRFDAGSYVLLTDALNRHDIGRDRGGLNKALESIKVPVLVAGVDTDILYPYHQQEHLSRNLGNLLAMAKIVSPVGHDAFLTESRQMDRIVRNFFSLISPDEDNPSTYIEFYI
ncbi:homoserine O-acetyltransferase [Corynebacterium glutamicum MB001]|uniref:Homoserine O-acetyltransferase n=1 Tax=Corynebacterium glutamicum (strain ATCC 13032 / DSM 20300 / JCM 1318 / BCRC 11384 / CCUG 27702 / LMG 3730 / NBRC 12168 / NCIMB 10025 / NRRL B-2784 / 534) TaxID=196627 RepID=METXA_CORGL|nr:homoserine O-acetyltransferase [Corynebacterium glutamicum]O68640.2 RecName: Full=Homoserine O-acetyltransferase; Short=HAT; AltName: Full=Homoserine transacetylase; Short=HTA [Corynebacterium glutamicum ATCC 13032]WLR81520.1 O-acetylhomoserine sulfhydrylase [synthetic construct]AGT04645.1 homoserine O-acetyltransferase [Corynebacterium glutamicum MB001]AIK84385.1 homoserine acetyltransferase [Corynebacterium glutamicum]AIK87170.1 homoserine acetyltransferase [Corynebacterium glutamicum]AR